MKFRGRRAVLGAVLLVAGCGPVAHGAAEHPTPSRTSSSPSPSASASPSPSPSRSAGPLAGRVVVLDPGHNDGNYGHAAQIDKLVNAGGFMKPCDTTGTSTDDGYTEAAFTFDVAKRLTKLLRTDGARVVLTRTDDHSVGPCVNTRAQIGNKAHANVALSIHADGGPPTGHGFHIMEPTKGTGHDDAIVAPSARFATRLRDAYRSGTGMPTSTYIGTNGLNPRSDMAGLNLSTVPKVLVECGNMRNAGDAALLKSASFRQKIARALAAGIVAYLSSKQAGAGTA